MIMHAGLAPAETVRMLPDTSLHANNDTWVWTAGMFLADQMHYFLRHISASLMHCTHVHKTKVTRPRPRRYIFKTETRPRRSKKTSRDHLETETFKTKTTSLGYPFMGVNGYGDIVGNLFGSGLGRRVKNRACLDQLLIAIRSPPDRWLYSAITVDQKLDWSQSWT